jgi:hypothetical protein
MSGSDLRRVRLAAAAQLVLAVLLLVGVWVLLPARHWPIDTAGSALALLQLGAAAGLFARKPWGVRLGLIAGWVTLVAGATLVTALALTVAHLSGLYGPVGAGGALLMAVIAALVLPYLVFLPALQIAWLRVLK